MDVRLTEGAILKITTEDHDEQYRPILQVLDVKQILAQSGGGGADKERYRLALSDGSHTQQGMISTQQNFLIQQGHLQKGFVVCLNQYTCTPVRGRQIIIIISLDVLVNTCEIIGQPATFSNAQSPATIPGNAQSLNSSARVAGHETVTEATPQQPRLNQSYGGSYSGGADPGRYATMSTVPNHPRPETGSGFAGLAPVSGSYAGQKSEHRFTQPHIPGSTSTSKFLCPPTSADLSTVTINSIKTWKLIVRFMNPIPPISFEIKLRN